VKLQVRAFLEKLQVSTAAKGEGHIHLFNTLLIGDKKYTGEQRISLLPFASKRYGMISSSSGNLGVSRDSAHPGSVLERVWDLVGLFTPTGCALFGIGKMENE